MILEIKCTNIILKHGVALTGRNSTGPPWSVSGPTARAAGRPARRQRYRRRQTTDADRRQNNTGPLGGPVIMYWSHGIELFYEWTNEKVTRCIGVALTTDVNRLHTPHLSLIGLLCCCKWKPNIHKLYTTLRTYRNAPTLLSTGRLSSLCNQYRNLIFASKKHLTLTLFRHPLTTPSASGKP